MWELALCKPFSTLTHPFISVTTLSLPSSLQVPYQSGHSPPSTTLFPSLNYPWSLTGQSGRESMLNWESALSCPSSSRVCDRRLDECVRQHILDGRPACFSHHYHFSPFPCHLANFSHSLLISGDVVHWEDHSTLFSLLLSSDQLW